jgi:hypothetical protein
MAEDKKPPQDYVARLRDGSVTYLLQIVTVRQHTNGLIELLDAKGDLAAVFPPGELQMLARTDHARLT